MRPSYKTLRRSAYIDVGLGRHLRVGLPDVTYTTTMPALPDTAMASRTTRALTTISTERE
jgi:hypothetical protein